MKLSLLILCIFFVNILYAGDPGLIRNRYALYENLQKSQQIDLSKIESLQLEENLFKLSKSEIENKFKYSFSKKYDLWDFTYVLVLNIFDNPASVKISYEVDKPKSMTIYFGRKNKFEEILPRLESLYGKSTKTEQKRYSTHVYWEIKSGKAVLNQLLSENLTTLELKE